MLSPYKPMLIDGCFYMLVPTPVCRIPLFPGFVKARD